MTCSEKAELLKSAIYQLYTNEGRSISYIARLLDINRKIIAKKINEWEFPQNKSVYYMKPSTRKQLNKHRQTIISLLEKDTDLVSIANKIKVSKKTLSSIWFKYDDKLNRAHTEWQNRRNTRTQQRIEDAKNNSRLNYDIQDKPNEKWADILGYLGYQVSTCGRIRKWTKRYNCYHLLKVQPNKNNGRLYVRISSPNNKSKNLNVARLVAQTFLPHDSIKNTVNHKDGNVQNNNVDNLEWCTQSENNKHSYEVLHHPRQNKKVYIFDYILYKNKYQFKTVAAFARFINKSETQTRRYLDRSDQHDIQLIHHCID